VNIFDRVSIAYKAFTNSEQFIGIDNPYYRTFQQIGGSFKFGSFKTEKAIDEGYAKNADLFSIVKRISETASDIPFALYDIVDGEKERVKDGELYDLIQQPNRLQTREEFVQEALIFLLLSGNNYVNGFRSLGMGDQIRELNNLPSQYVTIEGGSLDNPIASYNYQDVYNLSFDPNDVMHTKYPNPKGRSGVDRLYGLSPLEAGFNALQSSNNTLKARAHFAETTGVNGIISSGSERSIRPEDADKMQEAWDEKVKNLSKYGRNMVTSANINYTPLGIDPERLQLIESGIIDMRSLCNIYGVPSQLFNDVAGTTFNNMAAAKKSLYTEAVLPNLNLFLANYNNFFVSSWSKAEGRNYCVEADTSSVEVLQEDKKVEAEKDKIKMEGINTILGMPISAEGKSLLLQQEYGYSEEEAQMITINDQSNEVD
jgi:HK97 family phage portal protein